MAAKKKVLFIIGTTGAGKTKLSIEVAKQFDGEIVNSDALQMYSGLEISTAKASVEEQDGVPHHLLSVLAPSDECNVATFQKMALAKIDEIHSRHKLPIVVGGSMMYTQSLLWQSQLEENSTMQLGHCDEALHPNINSCDLHKKLSQVDPLMAERLHPNDKRRIEKSLHFFFSTGMKHSDQILKIEKEASSENIYDSCIIWIMCDRKILHERLDNRVDGMMNNGLLNEISSLNFELRQQNLVVEDIKTRGIFQAIGFKEFQPYFKAVEDKQNSKTIELALKSCVMDLKTATRRFARRQLTWIRNKIENRNKLVHVVDSSNINQWKCSVFDISVKFVSSFLNDQDVGSDCSKSYLLERSNSIRDWKKYSCEICSNRVFNGSNEWAAHLKSRMHKKRKRKSLSISKSY